MSETVLINPPESTPVAAPTGPLADLILARLLTAKKSVGSRAIRESLVPFFRQAPASESISDVVEALRTAGLISPRAQQLTEAGRERALRYLGTTSLPPKANWGTVKAKYLVPKALQLDPGPASGSKKMDADNLAALLLKRALGLPVGAGNTLNAVFKAIACRELGYPEQAKLEELVPLLLGKAIGSGEPISMENAEKIVPRALLNTPKPGIEGLRAIALRGLTGTAPPAVSKPTPPSITTPESFDLEAFANTVRSVARRSPSGWFGDNKVFISHVWRQLKDEPHFVPLGLTGFKEKLVEANRENLLTLSRADLVQVMDPVDVEESETAYLNAEFHFILVEKP